MNYFFNKSTLIALVAIAMTVSVSLIEKVVSASPENQTTIHKKLTDNIIAHQEGQLSDVIAIQPGPNNIQVELVSTKVTGQILTVNLRYLPKENGISTGAISMDPSEVSYIEDDTGKKYGVLQDESESYLASPKHRTGNIIFSVSSDPVIVWFKFPAPSPEIETISINIPEVFPFDGVPVQR